VFSHTHLPTKLLIPMHVKHTIQTCIYTCRLEDEPSGLKHWKTSKIKNYNINLEKAHFVGLYSIIINTQRVLTIVCIAVSSLS